MELRDQRILITGPGGQIAFPLAAELAHTNEVWGIARFSHPKAQARVESAGVRTAVVDLADPDFSALPEHFDHVLHLAVYQSPDADTDRALRVNAEGTGLLMSRFRRARFLVVSTTAVYAPGDDPARPNVESDPLGDRRQPYSPTYSISKIAQEAVARTVARQHGVATTIARMNVSYGANGGLPAYQLDALLAGHPLTLAPGGAWYHPIHERDIAAQVPHLLAAADTPATITNWGGDECVEAESWLRHLAELAGVEPKLERRDDAIPTAPADPTRRREITGPCRVGWREGMRAMAAARHPELALADPA